MFYEQHCAFILTYVVRQSLPSDWDLRSLIGLPHICTNGLLCAIVRSKRLELWWWVSFLSWRHLKKPLATKTKELCEWSLTNWRLRPFLYNSESSRNRDLFESQSRRYLSQIFSSPENHWHSTSIIMVTDRDDAITVDLITGNIRFYPRHFVFKHWQSRNDFCTSVVVDGRPGKANTHLRVSRIGYNVSMQILDSTKWCVDTTYV